MSDGLHKLDCRSGLVRNPLASAKGFRLGRPGDEDAPLLLYLRMDPEQSAPRHAHKGWACTLVLEGRARIGDHELGPGEMLLVEPGRPYGPVQPGPEGVVALEIFDSAAGVEQIWDESDPRVVAFRAAGGAPPVVEAT